MKKQKFYHFHHPFGPVLSPSLTEKPPTSHTMPKPVSMFKTDDGTLFENLSDAINHEQSVFLKSSLTPLFQRLVAASDDVAGAAIADRMVAVLGNDRELAADFQKAFAQLQTTPTTPAGRKRAPSGGRKKPAKPTPDVGGTVSPQATAVGDAAPPSVGAPPYTPSVGEPSEEYLAGIDSLGDAPISLPGDAEVVDETPPPPPQ